MSQYQTIALVCINSCQTEVTSLGVDVLSQSLSRLCLLVGSMSAVGRGSCDVFLLVPTTMTAVKNTGESLKAAGRQTQPYQLRLRSAV